MIPEKPTLKEKIAYALGDAAAGGITWKVMSIAFPLFFTNIFGLTVVDTATLMLVARLFDVVTDPIMGALADRTRSRWGTYRPWLIFGAVPLGLVFALLLFTPDFSPAGKRVWAYSLYLLMMAVYTAVNVPYGSLLGVMTDDDNEKNKFSSFRMVGAYAMGFITLLSFPYLQKVVGASVRRSGRHTGSGRGGDDPGLRPYDKGASETRPCGKVLFQALCRPGEEQTLGVSHPHRYMQQFLQRIPLCGGGIYVHVLPGR